MNFTVDASPTKQFFVHMITRDIDLEDAVLDLLDNCIDGARGYLAEKDQAANGCEHRTQSNLNDFHAEISLASEAFTIKDNCGGISIDNARSYAFHFGRRPDAPKTVEGSIGLYGIGMKRAVLKMGKKITIRSSTKSEAFLVSINVDNWLKDTKTWDFQLVQEQPWQEPGTIITVETLREAIAESFSDDVFINRLRETIARDYSFIMIENGFSVRLNGRKVIPYGFALKQSDEIKPASISYVDKKHEEADVIVEITAGMADAPPDDTSPETSEGEGRRSTNYYGWFVVCNNRVVLAGDKTGRTVWDDEGFPNWHTQYNGFMGIVRFTSLDPNRLPWTTTKRDIEVNSPIYRRAIVKMKDVTREWTKYTGRRKKNIAEAKEKEKIADSMPIQQVEERQQMLLPSIAAEPRVRMANISYQKPVSDVEKVREALNSPSLPYSEVGRRTFEYFMESEGIE